LLIPIALFKNGVRQQSYNFYVVRPFNMHQVVTAVPDVVLGQGFLGERSPRGAMIIDSLVAPGKGFTVSKNDPDVLTPGNQAYLPFTLISVGRIEVGSINVSADTSQGGVGGGGGGAR
jgi:hypothetical protein